MLNSAVHEISIANERKNGKIKMFLALELSDVVFTMVINLRMPTIVPDPSGINVKKKSCSTQLSMKFQLLMKLKVVKNKDFSCFRTLSYCIYQANKMPIVGILTVPKSCVLAQLVLHQFLIHQVQGL